MEKSELLELIPLYLTGKVSDDQKAAIERELLDSKEFRDEIAFWRTASVAVHKEVGYLAAGHLPGERIVDYARGVISDPLERVEIERHLQTCELCSNELETIKPAFDQATPVPLFPFFHRLIHGLAGAVRFVGKVLVPDERRGSGLRIALRPMYAFPLAALLIVSGVIIYRLATPTANPISFALQFQIQDRSSGVAEHRTLLLPQKVTVVHLSVPIPHATLRPPPGNITLTLLPPDGKEIQLTDGLSWSVGTPFDTTKVEAPVSALQASGIYVLRAVIKYESSTTPFEYSYRFGVVLGE